MKLKDFDFRIWDNHHIGCSNRDCKCKITKYVYGEVAKIRLSEFKEDCEIELWTGLYDKNNQKIYEGDIVSFIKGKVFVRYFLTESKFAFCVEQGGMFFLIEELRKLNASEYEVVGNIHENSELLKSKDSK